MYRTHMRVLYHFCCRQSHSSGQEDFKGVIQCTVLPNQIFFLTNHDKFHAADLQLLLAVF